MRLRTSHTNPLDRAFCAVALRQWKGSERHLLNFAFLRDSHRLMRPGGAFVLTNDDEAYCAAVAARMASDHVLKALWQPEFASPYYRTHEEGLAGFTSAFDQLWAARGFARRFQCRFVARRAPTKPPKAAAAATETHEDGDQEEEEEEDDDDDDDDDGGASAAAAVSGGGKRKKRKETSKQRKKRRQREKAVQQRGDAAE